MISQYVCMRCGLAVHSWGSSNKSWKHSGNGSSHSCGKKPMVVTRAAYDAMITDMLRTAQTFVHQQIGKPRLEKFNNRNESFASKKRKATNETR